MNPLSEIRARFSTTLSGMVDESDNLLAMIRPAGDSKFGDYQANCAMPLGKQLGRSPREIASEICESVQLDDLCQKVEIAGPGFINLTIDDAWLKRGLTAALVDDRLGVTRVSEPKTFVIDYSSPNVAKPMHVGHVRSTFIGDAISKVLRFVGHTAISDNHLGDWGTQFGMIIYGYKNFLDEAAYQQEPVAELGRLYKYVRKLMDYHAAVKRLPELQAAQEELKGKQTDLESTDSQGDKKAEKQLKKQLRQLRSKMEDQADAVAGLKAKILEVTSDSGLEKDAVAHPNINQNAQLETAALHEGDATNQGLWEEFLPLCRQDMQKIYDRLDIKFDYELGESFYHNELANVVSDLTDKGYTKESDGAICVFLDNHNAPMIIQKRDGAYLYSTTDLATIQYRMEKWNADACLYVVDHRQSEHFEKLFDVARLWGFDEVELAHVAFGTVMGPDGKPYKTRSGDTVGLSGLLDEAESRALEIATNQNLELTEDRHREIANVIGIGGLKYADLSHNRGSDYEFSYEKMLALRGNTATYLQYSYARVQGILRRTEADVDAIRTNPGEFIFENDVERQLGLKLIRFGEALDEVLVEYKPNVLCNYLFELSQLFAQFFDKCSVKDANSEDLKKSRLQLCDLTARTIRGGLELLGIGVLDKM